MRYLVTGATGFIGSKLAWELLQRGHEVVALVRDLRRSGALRELGAEVRQGDITNRSAVVAAMQGVDGVFHVAARYKIGDRDKQALYRTNVEGTRQVLEAMAELGIPRGVYTSSIAVFSDTKGRVPDESYRHEGPFLNEYERTKWMAHYEVALPMIARGLPLVIVMPGVVYGPGDTSLAHTLLRLYLRGVLLAVPGGVTYSWTYVDDVVEGHISAMERGREGESYILAGPGASLREVLQVASELTGVPAPKLEVPPRLISMASVLASGLERVVPLPPLLASETLRTIAGTTYLGNSAKAGRELGFSPRDLREGLEPTLQYEQARL